MDEGEKGLHLMERDKTSSYGAAFEPPTADHTAPDIAAIIVSEPHHVVDAAPPIAPNLEAPVSAPIPVAEPVSSIPSRAVEPSGPAVTALWERLRQFGPRRRGSDDNPIPAAPEQPAGEDNPTDSARSRRFMLLAASITVAACVGAAAGAAGFAGAAKLMASSEPAPASAIQRSDLAAETKALKDSIAQVRASIKTLSDSVASLKTGIDASGKANGAAIAKLNEQVGKLQEGMDRFDRSRGEVAARSAKSSDASHRPPSAPEVTGSVPAPTPRPLETAPGPKPLGVVDGWSLRRVYGGVALVDSRFGEVEVMAGDTVRGLGRIHEIKRQDGRWVVVTERGLIVSR